MNLHKLGKARHFALCRYCRDWIYCDGTNDNCDMPGHDRAMHRKCYMLIRTTKFDGSIWEQLR